MQRLIQTHAGLPGANSGMCASNGFTNLIENLARFWFHTAPHVDHVRKRGQRSLDRQLPC